MELRDLRWTDFDAFLETYFELYDARDRGEIGGIHLFAERPSRADEVQWFGDHYRGVLAGERVCVVADVDGRAVGHCDIWPVVPGGPASDGGHLGELGILLHRDHRDRGYGRAMMRRALELARPRFEIVRLWVNGRNARAQHLYTSLGFVPVGRIPDGMRQGTRYDDLVLMVYDLRPGARAGARENG